MAWDTFLSDKYGPPRGVTRREWNNALTFKAIGGFLMLFAALGLAYFILAPDPVKQVDNAQKMSLQQVMAYQGALTGPVVVTALLKSHQPATMPDSDEKVVYGKLQVIVKASGRIEQQEQAMLEKALIDWQFIAPDLYLQDAEYKLGITLNSQQLPRKIDRSARVSMQYEGKGRLSQPIAAKYNNKVYPLALESWGWERAISKVQREFLLDGELVSLVGFVQQGSIAQVQWLKRGTPEQVKQQLTHQYYMMIIVILLMAIGGFLLFRKGERHKHFLIQKSKNTRS